MTQQRSSDRAPGDLVSGEALLADLYRSAATESPPPTIDRAIEASARAAVQTSRVKRWAVPLSIAAVVVVTVSVVLRLSEHGSLEPLAPLRTATEARSPAVSAAVPPKANQPEAERQDKSVSAERFNEQRVATPFAGQREEAMAAARSSTAPAAPSAAQAPAEATQQEKSAPTSTSGEQALAGRFAAEREDARPAIRARREDTSRTQAALAQGSEAKRAGAEIVAVSVSGKPGAYEFDVTVRSPDTGCAQYADWWEVVGTDGRLLYRRVLDHSHPDEQPFARSGGPVPIARDAIVWVRVHMNNSGYGSVGFKGSVAGGFTRTPIAPDFAADLPKQPPLPHGCAF
ncbi:MAG: hypothetical protein ACJ8KO_09815 [Sulfurifustaceae bacterium]